MGAAALFSARLLTYDPRDHGGANGARGGLMCENTDDDNDDNAAAADDDVDDGPSQLSGSDFSTILLQSATYLIL